MAHPGVRILDRRGLEYMISYTETRTITEKGEWAGLPSGARTVPSSALSFPFLSWAREPPKVIMQRPLFLSAGTLDGATKRREAGLAAGAGGACCGPDCLRLRTPLVWEGTAEKVEVPGISLPLAVVWLACWECWECWECWPCWPRRETRSGAEAGDPEAGAGPPFVLVAEEALREDGRAASSRSRSVSRSSA